MGSIGIKAKIANLTVSGSGEATSTATPVSDGQAEPAAQPAAAPEPGIVSVSNKEEARRNAVLKGYKYDGQGVSAGVARYRKGEKVHVQIETRPPAESVAVARSSVAAIREAEETRKARAEEALKRLTEDPYEGMFKEAREVADGATAAREMYKFEARRIRTEADQTQDESDKAELEALAREVDEEVPL